MANPGRARETSARHRSADAVHLQLLGRRQLSKWERVEGHSACSHCLFHPDYHHLAANISISQALLQPQIKTREECILYAAARCLPADVMSLRAGQWDKDLLLCVCVKGKGLA